MSGSLGQLPRLIRTVRHLRVEQILWRLRYRMIRPRPDVRPAPPLRAMSGDWAIPCGRAARVLSPVRFSVAGFDYDVRGRGWDDPSVSELVRYNLHYLDWVADVTLDGDTAGLREHVHRWQHGNPVGFGTGWHAYPTSLRIVNLLKREWDRPFFDAAIIASVAVQSRWLSQCVEWHILGNHLIANGKALCFAGLFFEGPESDRLFRQGVEILERELKEQILRDGGHFERSPMYHAIVLEDVLDLVNLFAAFDAGLDAQARALSNYCRALVGPMMRWLDAMTHPDGGPAFFNDCCLDVASSAAELRAYAERLGLKFETVAMPPLLFLSTSGYVRMQRGPATIFVDVGAIGPDYIPGHAHADTLSIECSIDGKRVLVNSGTSDYGTGVERQRQRGTASHNTVSVDGIDSSEVWGGFRVGRRAKILEATVFEESGAVEVHASHAGYRWLKGAPVHRRQVALTPTALEIRDNIAVKGRGVAHWHLAPSAECVDVAGGFEIRLDGVRRLRLGVGSSQACQRTPDRWHAGFGRTQKNESLHVGMPDGSASLRLDWAV